ncbi:MAG: septum formation initiator family protein [Candidatus Susulua stagnicola]|nr:septum formation initiator family protein [Candidatus Susulua stagnicola]
MVEKLFNISKNKWIGIAAGILFLFILVMMIYFPNYARLKKIRDENKRIVLENAGIIEEIKDYEDKLKMVGEDPYLYEKIAREELGIARDGEIVIDIEE